MQWGAGLGESPPGLAQPMDVPSVNQTQVCATSHGSVPFTQLHPQQLPSPSGGPYWSRGSSFGGAEATCLQELLPNRPPLYAGRKRSTALRGIGEISAPWGWASPRPASSAAARSIGGPVGGRERGWARPPAAGGRSTCSGKLPLS